MTGRAAWPILAALLVVLGLVAWLGTGVDRSSGPPLDPRSTDPDGARAFFTLLGDLGREVDVSRTLPTQDGTVVVLTDREADREALIEWVEGGGTAVVFDPFSSLAPEVVGTGPAPDPLAGCSLPVLEQARAIDVPVVRGFAGDGCFVAPSGGVLVGISRLGAGRVVAVGTDAVVQNRRLALADNSVIAVGAVAQAPDPIVFIEPGVVGAGDETLLELVPAAVWAALIQSAIAFGFYALYRARRHGRPIVESQPVAISGSELTRAAGRLLQRHGAVGRAGELIGGDVERFLATRGSPSDQLSALEPPGDESELVHYAQQAERIRLGSRGDPQ